MSAEKQSGWLVAWRVAVLVLLAIIAAAVVLGMPEKDEHGAIWVTGN